MKRLLLILCNRCGSATVEFALASLFFLGIMTVALDFGVYVQQRLKLGSAAEQGAILAFNMGDAIDPHSVAALVKTAGALPIDPDVSCNGGQCNPLGSRDTSNGYRCINQTTGALDAATHKAGDNCPGGGTAGYYLKIVAHQTYNTMVVPDRWLGGSTMTQTAVVRLQ